jgi:hypothetical protein
MHWPFINTNHTLSTNETNREGTNNYFSNLDTIVLPLPYHQLPIGNSMSSFHREQGQFVVPSFVLFDEKIMPNIAPNETQKKKKTPATLVKLTIHTTLVKLTIHHISQADHSHYISQIDHPPH